METVRTSDGFCLLWIKLQHDKHKHNILERLTNIDEISCQYFARSQSFAPVLLDDKTLHDVISPSLHHNNFTPTRLRRLHAQAEVKVRGGHDSIFSENKLLKQEPSIILLPPLGPELPVHVFVGEVLLVRIRFRLDVFVDDSLPGPAQFLSTLVRTLV